MTCLPALETVQLNLYLPFASDLGCLLEALAWCPRLQNLDLSMMSNDDTREGDEHLYLPFPAHALANLSSLTSLAWRSYTEEDPYSLADVVGALVSITGLAELQIGSSKPAMVPAALGHHKGLRVLELYGMCPCVLEAGCLDLPILQSLDFKRCTFQDAGVLPGVSALQRLTRIEVLYGEGPVTFVPQLVHLFGLQRLVLPRSPYSSPPGLLRLPADMGALKLGLQHLNLKGRKLTHFPLALTQLVALEHLDASANEFAELPAGITALSRLTELMLGQLDHHEDLLQLHEKRPLDVRALGDLSRFPALCELTFSLC